MSFTKYLELDTMHTLVEGIQKSATPATLEDVRNELLNAIDPGFVVTLSGGGNARNKILSDLNTMNTVPYLLGDEVPLQLWLTNAVNYLRASRRPQTPFFQEVLENVTSQSQKVIAEASGVVDNPATLSQEERIIHKDDMLSFGWLRKALAVGRGVARLTVPRYEDGYPTGVQYYGTGWLIGPQHLMTNHHVINARSQGEDDAAEADLHLQTAATVVAFDYDALDLKGDLAEVETLCAWGVHGGSSSLDYAILKLKKPIENRKPLTLAPTKLQHIEQRLKKEKHDKPPVNIIQHPGGRPKMLGIRNNLAHQVTATELSYFTDTEGGSSGSPVCDDEWQVLALHRRWERFHEKNVLFQGKATAWENRGTRIDCLVADMKARYPELWDEIGVIISAD